MCHPGDIASSEVEIRINSEAFQPDPASAMEGSVFCAPGFPVSIG